MSHKTSICCEKEDRQVLLLNASEEVIKIIDWYKAVTLLFSGKAEKPFNYEEYHEIRTSGGIYKLPTAIVLVEYVNIPYKNCHINRRNILRRDKFTCQYCEKVLSSSEYTIDHLIPRSRGGKNTWKNLVTSCRKCNTKKANRTPKEANMKLLKEPKEPTRDFIHITGINTNTNKAWSRWIEIKGDLNESI